MRLGGAAEIIGTSARTGTPARPRRQESGESDMQAAMPHLLRLEAVRMIQEMAPLTRYARSGECNIATAGDSFFARFEGPARAIRCAREIVEAVHALDLQVRAGLHTGECEIVDGKAAGIAVHTAARVATLARVGEVLVSSTVKDLVAGSGIQFDSRGRQELKGIGEWDLYSVTPMQSESTLTGRS